MSRVFHATISAQGGWTWDNAKPFEVDRGPILGKQCPRFVRGDKLYLTIQGCTNRHKVTLTPPQDAHGIIRLPFAFPHDTLTFGYNAGDCLVFVGSSEIGGHMDWSFTIAEEGSKLPPIDPEFQVGPGAWATEPPAR